MKLSRILRAISAWFAPKDKFTKATHIAYFEVMPLEDGKWVVRIYEYGHLGGRLLEEVQGEGGTSVAQRMARRAMKAYRRK